MSNVPSNSQRRLLWTAVTALSIAAIGALVVGLIYLIGRVLSFLQPILVPFAVAGVLAYLLEPVVAWLGRRKVSRNKAVWLVFSLAMLVFVGFILALIPAVKQGAELAKDSSHYITGAREKIVTQLSHLEEKLRKDYNIDLLHLKDAKPPAAPATNPPSSPAPTPPSTATTPPATSPPAPTDANESPDIQSLFSGEWLQRELPGLMTHVWDFIRSGVGGFLGVFGFLLSLVIVPLYLYYFLTEGPRIADGWTNYLPLRASHFKDEVVGTLTEINGYLIAFFRGQLVVSMINGVFTAIGLSLLGLEFGWLIGLSLCFLGIIPYLGIAMCWIPAMIIAIVQGGSWLIPDSWGWWGLPLMATGVFFVVQHIDSLFITPRVVGDRVGLHPMTVIASVFAWPLILGGLLGAILAVPMTASVKVLFQRYIWERAKARKAT
jgi:predicted PurR-regulated permease PerM